MHILAPIQAFGRHLAASGDLVALPDELAGPVFHQGVGAALPAIFWSAWRRAR